MCVWGGGGHAPAYACNCTPPFPRVCVYLVALMRPAVFFARPVHLDASSDSFVTLDSSGGMSEPEAGDTDLRPETAGGQCAVPGGTVPAAAAVAAAAPWSSGATAAAAATGAPPPAGHTRAGLPPVVHHVATGSGLGLGTGSAPGTGAGRPAVVCGEMRLQLAPPPGFLGRGSHAAHTTGAGAGAGAGPGAAVDTPSVPFPPAGPLLLQHLSSFDAGMHPALSSSLSDLMAAGEPFPSPSLSLSLSMSGVEHR